MDLYMRELGPVQNIEMNLLNHPPKNAWLALFSAEVHPMCS